MCRTEPCGKAEAGQDMIASPKQLGPEAQQEESLPVARGGETRASALAELLADPEVRKQVGAAWPLYVLMVAGWGGVAEGTRDEIGGRLGEDGRNISNWVDRLVQAGIATVEKSSRRVEVKLAGEHMRVAKLPDAVTVVNEKQDDEPNLDERQRQLLGMIQAAEALGGTVEIRTPLVG